MKAIFIKEFGPSYSLEIRETDRPQPRANEVLIQVEAAGMNRAELMVLQGDLPQYIDESPIMGIEIAGTVVETGSGVTNWKQGDRVAALLKNGGYGEYAVAHEGLTFALPPFFSFSEMAAIPEAFLLSYQLLKWLAEVKEHDTVLIHAGASGMGSVAIQMAKAIGVKVISTCRSLEKAEFTKSLAADVSLVVANNQFSKKVLDATSGLGVQAILDPVGQTYFNENLKSLAQGGRLILYGALGGEVEATNPASVIYKWAHIIGTTLRPRPMEYKTKLVREMISFAGPLFSSGKLRPLIYTSFPIEQIAEAYKVLSANRNLGKIILTKFS